LKSNCEMQGLERGKNSAKCKFRNDVTDERVVTINQDKGEKPAQEKT